MSGNGSKRWLAYAVGILALGAVAFFLRWGGRFGWARGTGAISRLAYSSRARGRSLYPASVLAVVSS